MSTIISLFDRTWNWSAPYKAAGYEVFTIDLQTGHNIFDLTSHMCANFHPVQGLLMAPPCDDFAVSGSSHFAAKDNDGRTATSIALVRQCLKLRDWFAPKWWALENPVGRLNSLIPELAPYGPRYFQPWWWGRAYNEAYTKKTGLWGIFTFPPHTFDTEITPDFHITKDGFTAGCIMKLGGKSQKTKNLRSATPRGFADAFFAANP